jgi:hypothetical protein
VFSTYVLFSRQPDYFDGEITTATIHWRLDTLHQHKIPAAYYSIGKNYYSIDARYVFRNLTEGKSVNVIYEAAKPDKAAVYNWWGYWITMGELIASIVLLVALFQIAVVVNKNPTAEALLEQVEFEPEKKRRYSD